ncbi:hypothetical protein C4577_06480 [Candidatus Parcubacteria bacterium]|nr:MAG: hypothetical protein C4577_06480 [Candidatus Parcubacteria bacterium]
MRKDMGKVITERPRRGMRYKAPKGSKKEIQKGFDEDSPKTENIRKKWRKGFNGKEFTDVLGPLRGYVLSVIGRPFDKVFSEICEVLKPTGLSGSHAQDHLWDMLLRNVKIDENGRVCYPDDYRSFKDLKEYEPISPGKYYNIAYVDPRDGIIKKIKEPKRNVKQKKKEVVRVIINDKFQCHKINDLWYMVEVKPVKFYYRDRISRIGKFTWYYKDFIPYEDMLIGTVREAYQAGNFYGGALKAVSKRQMNKKEIKKYVADKIK